MDFNNDGAKMALQSRCMHLASKLNNVRCLHLTTEQCNVLNDAYEKIMNEVFPRVDAAKRCEELCLSIKGKLNELRELI